MIIPIGHERMSVRRLPWVTFTIMAACLLALIAANHNGVSEAEVGEFLQSSVEYYVDHPYLELDERLRQTLKRVLSAKDWNLLERFIAENEGGRSVPAIQKLEEQAELDRLVEQTFDAINQMPNRRWGLIPAHVTLLAFLTHMFMHAGYLHLFGNLLILYLSGPFVEDVWGRPLFIFFYLASGMVSALMFMVHYPGLLSPLVGASGAIAGVMGAFFVRHWSVRIRFFYWFGVIFRGTFTAPAWAILPIWVFGELLSAWLTDHSVGVESSGVAYWAHVWGFVFGVLFALGMRFFDIESRYIRPAMGIEARVHPALTQAEQALEKGHRLEAYHILNNELKKSDFDLTLAERHWEVAVSLKRAREAAPTYARVLRDELRRGDLEAAYSSYQQLTELAPDHKIDADSRARLAEYLAQQTRVEEALPIIRSLSDALDSTTPLGLLIRAARAALATGDEVVEKVVPRALEHPELPETVREELTAGLGVVREKNSRSVLSWDV